MITFNCRSYLLAFFSFLERLQVLKRIEWPESLDQESSKVPGVGGVKRIFLISSIFLFMLVL